LSYAIEPIRYLYTNPQWQWSSIILHAPWADVSFGAALLVLVGFAVVSLLIIQPLLRRRLT
jgi:ABC-2 type transport system permease protein